MEKFGATVSRLVPEMAAGQSIMPSPTSPTSWDSPTPRRRLSDVRLAQAQEVADMPLPAPEPATDQQINQALLTLLAILPKRGSDAIAAALLCETYARKLRGYPKAQIDFLADRAMDQCKWFPTIAECIEIMGAWKRDDEFVRRKARAQSAVVWEKQARFDELMARLARGECDQGEIDGLSDACKRIGEERGYLRRDGDGYVVRTPDAPVARLEAPRRAAPKCSACHDVGRILTLEGDEVDCPSCAIEAAA